jgi:hypothetical protein
MGAGDPLGFGGRQPLSESTGRFGGMWGFIDLCGLDGVRVDPDLAQKE